MDQSDDQLSCLQTAIRTTGRSTEKYIGRVLRDPLEMIITRPQGWPDRAREPLTLKKIRVVLPHMLNGINRPLWPVDPDETNRTETGIEIERGLEMDCGQFRRCQCPVHVCLPMKCPAYEEP